MFFTSSQSFSRKFLILFKFAQSGERTQDLLIFLSLYRCATLDSQKMEQHALKNLSNSLNTNIYSYLETSGRQSSNLHLNVVHFFNTSLNQTSVAVQDNCFLALVSNMCCSIVCTYIFWITLILCNNVKFIIFAF